MRSAATTGPEGNVIGQGMRSSRFCRRADNVCVDADSMALLTRYKYLPDWMQLPALPACGAECLLGRE